MSTATRSELAGLTTVRTVGGLIPADLLGRIVAGTDLPGLTADDYRLELGVSPREAANRAWSVLTGAWAAYRDALAKRPEADRATGLTRDKWLSVLLRELGFGRVPTTPAGGLQADGRAFPISHQWREVPIHLLGWEVELDRKTPGVPGAADRAPHAMLQELLNRSGEHLWGMLANGATLRLLRDSSSLVGQSYVEFDLEAMFAGEIFSDFAVLFFICHQTRFEPVDPEAGPEDCWLERWRTDAVETGARALGALRVGVQQAIETLATGFLQHPANADLRKRIDSDLTLADYHRALLRLVYRLLFCFVAEDRDLLLDPNGDVTARRRYTDWFSTGRLRRIALRRRGTRHSDLWRGLSIVIDGLGREGGRPELAVPGLGGLFEDGPADVVAGAELANDALLAAIRHLCVIRPAGGGPKRTVDYRNLGAEELGGIYESLLEFVPRYDSVNRAFTLESLVGNERKTSGAYYTPTSLIDCLLDSALDPLLDEAERMVNPEQALFELTVCDPACGSGHFLVAAARRIAARLARVRADGSEPTALEAQASMHDVVAKCIFGVDLNPMAAELAKVSLWLEALQPGRPLSFLDAHIKVGNALLGTVPSLLAAGVPDDAFAALEGDDKKIVAALKKRNRTEREGQSDLFVMAGIRVGNEPFARAAREVDSTEGLSIADIQLAQRRQRDLEQSPELRRARLIANAWCAAFVVQKDSTHLPITHSTLEAWQSLPVASIELDPTAPEVEFLSARFRFFHWHLEFPQIFNVPDVGTSTTPTGWRGGFSCVLGNPPWERMKLQEQEFFAARDPAIASAPNAAARKSRIKELASERPTLFAEFEAAKRQADAESHFVRASDRYPLCGRGDVNTYAVFAELDLAILDSGGRIGAILPTGIATDATTQHFFKAIAAGRSLASLYDFENSKPLFDGVHRSYKFCLLTLVGRATEIDAARFAFFLREPAEIAVEWRTFALTTEEIRLLSPNTGTCPVFRSRRDAELTIQIHRAVPVLIVEGPPEINEWGFRYLEAFHSAHDSQYLRDPATDDGCVRFMEAKLVHLFDHRWASFEDGKLVGVDRTDPCAFAQGRYVVPREVAVRRFEARGWHRPWRLAWRAISRSTDERTLIAVILPEVVMSDSLPVATIAERSVPRVPCLLANLSSLVCDFVARQKVGGANFLFFHVRQLAVLPPGAFEGPAPWDSRVPLATWVQSRVMELVYTAWDLEGFATEFECEGPPFQWSEDRREVLTAELDAAILLLYDVDRGDAEYILDTFPLVHRSDVATHGEERTRRLILESYDRLSSAIETRDPFTSMLDPAPGHGPRHPAR